MSCLVMGLRGVREGLYVCVCVWTGWWQGGGRRGGSYLFVLPSRRVREQIKGFSLRGGTDLNSSPICIPGWRTQTLQGGQRNQEVSLCLKWKQLRRTEGQCWQNGGVTAEGKGRPGCRVVDTAMPLPVVWSSLVLVLIPTLSTNRIKDSKSCSFARSRTQRLLLK